LSLNGLSIQFSFFNNCAMGCTASSGTVAVFSEVGKSCGAETVKRTSQGHTSIHAEFVIGERLGKGAYGHVYSVQRRSAGKDDELAVKTTDCRKPPKHSIDEQKQCHDLRRRAFKEAHLLKLFKNQARIIDFKGHFMESGIHYILMEKCPFGFRQLLAQRDVNEAFYALVFNQMLQALQVIHGLNVIHRDIKPDNFLFTRDWTVKLCDFGLAEQLSSSRSKTSGTHGTLPYMSPEMVNEEGHNTKTDIWSLGVTAYLLLYGIFPYMPEMPTRDMKMAIYLGLPAPIFHPCQACAEIKVSTSVEQFLRMLLQRKPRRRPCAKAAMKHPWIAMASAQPEASLPSMRPMFDSAHDLGAFGQKETVGLASPYELDTYFQMQQGTHRRHAPSSLPMSSKASEPQATVPGELPSPTTSSLNMSDAEKGLDSEASAFGV